MIFKIAQKSHTIWATFLTTNFQKSTNLVTLALELPRSKLIIQAASLGQWRKEECERESLRKG